LYELARAGKEVERKPVPVSIHNFEPLKPGEELIRDNSDGTYDFEARIECSSGTYIRTLAEDFGKRLNVGAHLAELRRTRVGKFGIDEARALDRIKMNIAEEAVGKILLPMDHALSQLPAINLTPEDVVRVSHGLNVPSAGISFNSGDSVRLRDAENNLVAIGEFDAADQSLHPKIVFAPYEK
jgi:tRNA pseudouridine55 synthase